MIAYAFVLYCIGRPRDLNEAIREGFFEWELKEKTSSSHRSTENKSKSKNGGANTAAAQQTTTFPQVARKSWNGGRPAGSNAKPSSNCSHCGRGPHREEDYWFKHPDKHPFKTNKKVNSLFARMVVADNQSPRTIARKSWNGGRPAGSNAKPSSNCSHCGRGPHREEDCWFKYPDKRPFKTNKKVNSLFARMVVADNQSTEETDQLNE
ncbi:Hypothetical protein PHPALM_12698 [Phytophthora palmivora]|uniref:Uncharacterized protein n=1 Tax=Phytophthora palmivora TaxID=4796 RepID=A0A2P4XZ29_9STRA|nr:Hypothetical protein PHPALM_12698 [Phytophthora palmivora]